MSISDALIPEFDRETATTRKLLERVPEERFAYKPHEKSMSLGDLAVHLSEIPHWVVPTLQQESLDLAPVGGEPYRRIIPKTHAELLARFDKNVSDGRAALAATPDSAWPANWSLLFGGKQIFQMPRTAVIRTMVLSHMIHHRAQLGVYLRLNDIPLPMTYGPSADEGQMPR